MNRTDLILESFRKRYLHSQFNWENNNCVTFASGVIKALYGKDCLKYEKFIKGSTAQAFYKFLKQNDKTLADLVTEELGAPLKFPQQAKAGDVVVEGQGLEQNVGICYSSGRAFFLKEKGLWEVNTKYCTYAWRIK